jgi:hypothetical protein
VAACAAAAALAVIGVSVALLAPGVDRAKRAAAASAARRDAAATAEQVARARTVQRLHVAVARTRVPGAGVLESARLRARSAIVGELSAAVLTDARARARAGTLPGPVLSVSCAPYPAGSVAAERLPSARFGSYACLAVNVAVAGTGGRAPVAHIGDPFWARVDFATSRIAWCKILPRPGEQAVGATAPSMPLAPACDLERPVVGRLG